MSFAASNADGIVPAASAPLLRIQGLISGYGRVTVLKGIDLDVHAGEIVALIGANGAGKSTLMMTIFGNPRASDGSIAVDGRDITALPTHPIARLHIARAVSSRRCAP